LVLGLSEDYRLKELIKDHLPLLYNVFMAETSDYTRVEGLRILMLETNG
jgi:hypothetical protein